MIFRCRGLRPRLLIYRRFAAGYRSIQYLYDTLNQKQIVQIYPVHGIAVKIPFYEASQENDFRITGFSKYSNRQQPYKIACLHYTAGL